MCSHLSLLLTRIKVRARFSGAKLAINFVLINPLSKMVERHLYIHNVILSHASVFEIIKLTGPQIKVVNLNLIASTSVSPS